VAAVRPTRDHPTPGSDVSQAIESSLTEFVSAHAGDLAAIAPDLAMLASAVAPALRGGKRLRPIFAYWGWRSVLAAGAPGEESLIRAAAALELLHGCAVVQDDVMDSSDTRRGRPASHVGFATEHAGSGRPGRSETFGRSAAVLLGDLLLSWAGEMFIAATEQLPAHRRDAARSEFSVMRTEMVAGQFLDVLGHAREAFEPADALRVAEFKTSRYSVQRPVRLGALAAGAPPSILAALTNYGAALGEAFQLRDDLLGVFGDPEVTGKPAGLDLLEGKQTVLVAVAAERAGEQQRRELAVLLGAPDLDEAALSRIRDLLVETGGRAELERWIRAAVDRARRAITHPVPGAAALRPEAEAALLELADLAAHRDF
jgi:geranylgeranyl diphosphate synthase type I